MLGLLALPIVKRLGPLLAIGLALAAAYWVVDRTVHALKQAGRDEVQARWDASTAASDKAKVDLQAAVATALQPKFDALDARIGSIGNRAADISVRLPQAIASAPRYRDPACALTTPVLDQVNAARALSTDARP
jgi:hypothetical protein